MTDHGDLGNFLANLAAELGAKVIEAWARRAGEQIYGAPREQAVRRCLDAGLVAFVRYAQVEAPAYTELLETTGAFFHRDDVVREITRLLRGQPLDVDELQFLFEEAGYPSDDLFDFAAAMTDFEGIFLLCAVEEQALQDTVKAAQLLQQTRLLEAQLRLLQEMLTVMRQNSLGAIVSIEGDRIAVRTTDGGTNVYPLAADLEQIQRQPHLLAPDPRTPIVSLSFDNGQDLLEIPKSRLPDTIKKRDLAERAVRLDTKLVNSGTRPASDVRLFLEFENDLRLYNTEDFRQHWKIHPIDLLSDPEAYIKARFDKPSEKPLIQQLLHGVAEDIEFSVFEDHIASRRRRKHVATEGIISPQIEGNVVKFQLDKLKHNMTQPLESVYVVFDTRESIRSFIISSVIVADEIPAEIKGRLHVEIKTEDLSS